jgi:hypothetical protein
LGGCLTGVIFAVVWIAIGLGCYFLFGPTVAVIVAVAIFLPLQVVISFLCDRDDFLAP